MRRILALFLALLLTLTGLQGTAMAMEMAAPQAAAHHVASADEARHDHAAPAAHDCCADASDPSGPQHQGDCARCGACHTAPQMAAAELPSPMPASAALHTTHASRFASAALAQAIKPPIF